MSALKKLRKEEEEPTRPILYQEYLEKKQKEQNESKEEVQEEEDPEESEGTDIKELLIKYLPIAGILVLLAIIGWIILHKNDPEQASISTVNTETIATSNDKVDAVRTNFGNVRRSAVSTQEEASADDADAEAEKETNADSINDTSSETNSTAQVQGDPGKDGIDGESGLNGIDGKDGVDGVNGIDGKSGTNGPNGKNGERGKDGVNGVNGNDGKNGTDGANGKSAYEVAVEAGYTGSETNFATLLSTADTRFTTIEGNVTPLNDSLKEVFTSVSDGKNNVASAISDKGVTTASDATFQVMHDNILTLATQQYNTGYADGLAAIDNASVTYVRHNHTGNSSVLGGCYTVPNYHRHVEGVCYYRCSNHTGDMLVWLYQVHHKGEGDLSTYRCKYCGLEMNDYSDPGSAAANMNRGLGDFSNPIMRCGKDTSTIDSYSPSCGYTDGQILSATINY